MIYDETGALMKLLEKFVKACSAEELTIYLALIDTDPEVVKSYAVEKQNAGCTEKIIQYIVNYKPNLNQLAQDLLEDIYAPICAGVENESKINS